MSRRVAQLLLVAALAWFAAAPAAPAALLPGEVEWAFAPRGPSPGRFLPPAAGPDGTLYTASYQQTSLLVEDRFYAVRPDGTLKWELDRWPNRWGTAAVRPDGTVCVSEYDRLLSLSPAGVVLWECELAPGFVPGSATAVGPDGTAYVVGRRPANPFAPPPLNLEVYRLYAVSKEGEVLWSAPLAPADDSGQWWTRPDAWWYGDAPFGPVVLADGTVLVAHGSPKRQLVAFSPLGQVRWATGWGFGHVQRAESFPVAGADGTTYVVTEGGILHAVNPDGSDQWSTWNFDSLGDAPALAADGTILITGLRGLHALDHEGREKWLCKLPWGVGTDSRGVLVGDDGTAYVGRDTQICAVDSAGSLAWCRDVAGDQRFNWPVMSVDGTLYVGGDRLYAIQTASAGPAASPWPMLRGNSAQTGYQPAPQRLGRIVGTVRDGAAGFAGVRVTTGRDGFGITAVSGADGSFSLESVIPGAHKVVATKPGYRKVTAEVSVPAGGTLPLDLSLTPDPAYVPDGEIAWVLAKGGGLWGSPTVGPDGTIYAIMGQKLFAVAPSGAVRWSRDTELYATTPSLAPDGTLYARAEEHLYAIDSANGELRRAFFAVGAMESRHALAIGSDGTIYVPTNAADSHTTRVRALDPDGAARWEVNLYPAWYVTSPVVGRNGDVCFLSSANAESSLGRQELRCVARDGTPRWTRQWQNVSPTYGAPAVGADGTLYLGLGDGTIRALDPQGEEKWSFQTGRAVSTQPAVGADGTVYVASYDGNLYALRPDGTVKWAAPVGWAEDSTPALGADGTLYLRGMYGNLYAVGADGTVLWTLPVRDDIFYSPAIGPDGTVYFVADRGLYAVKARSGGPATAPWGGLQQGSARSGAAQIPFPALGSLVGRVTEAASGLPVPAVKITPEGAGQFAWSDADGRYSLLHLPVGAYSVTFAKEGYALAAATVTTQESQTAFRDAVLLPPGVPATVAGVVRDGVTQAALPGAEIRATPGSLRATTDAQGAFLLSLAPGQYTLRVVLAGYETLEVPANLASGENPPLLLALTPEAQLPGNATGLGEGSTDGSGGGSGGCFTTQLAPMPWAAALAAAGVLLGIGARRRNRAGRRR